MKEMKAYKGQKELISSKNDMAICPLGTSLLPPEFQIQ